MARVARVVAIGYPHHITQRGNNQQQVFLDDADRNKYLKFIAEYSTRFKLRLLAYCLMPNHVHFIAIPEREDSLARTFNCAHMRYSQYFNKKAGTSGHLWQGRFYSCILDQPHLEAAVRYIENNPIRAKMVKKAWAWRWSSASYHAGEGKGLIPLGDISGFIDISQDLWKDFLETQDDERVVEELKRHNKTGLPLGTEEFIRELENKVGRPLKAVPRGRPFNK